ncbi:MAG: ATP-binding protein [Pseudomonadota bacterium]
MSPPHSSPPAPDGGVSTRLTWLLVFRSLVMGALLIVSVLANLTEPSMLSDPPQVTVYGSVAFSFAVILLGALWQRRDPEHYLGMQVAIQIGGDLVMATALVFATGGVDSAFIFLFSLSVINAAALSYRPGALLTAGTASLMLLALSLAQRFGLGTDIMSLHIISSREVGRSLLFNASALFLVAMLAAYVSEQLRQTGASLQEARVDLTRLETLHAAVLSSLTSGLMAVDDQFRVTLLNRAGELLLRRRGEQVVGLRADDVLPGVEEHLNREAGSRFELHSTGPEIRILGCSVAPLSGAVLQLQGYVLTFQDLTEIRALEEAIQRSERLATVGQFAAGLAHELRNPLGSLTGCVELLQRSVSETTPRLDSTAQAKLFDIVLREAERLNKLLSDFLQYARPSPTERREVRLAGLVEDTILVAQRELDGAEGPRIETQIEDPTLVVDGDLGQLKQVLWNLLRNATAAAGTHGLVRVSVSRAGAHQESVAVDVEDSGSGVPVELRSRIFDPFFTTKEGGTGLGLPTVLRIVEQHDATIRVLESPLGGARLHILFPVPSADAISLER